MLRSSFQMFSRKKWKRNWNEKCISTTTRANQNLSWRIWSKTVSNLIILEMSIKTKLSEIMQTNLFQYLWFIPLWIISKMKISHKVTNFAHNLFINQEETMKLYSVFPFRATKLSFQVISRTFIAPFILLLDHAWLSAKQSSLETKKKLVNFNQL